MTVNEFKTEAIRQLSAITENPRFEAEQLIMWALKIHKNDILLKRRDVIDECQMNVLKTALKRRINREPLQYICGEWDFFGLRMFCGKGCLIPRPETEKLAEFAIDKLPRGGHLVDLCTGSGCIAVSVLNNRTDVTATAVDISEDALKYAKKNAEYHGVLDRIEFICQDIADYIPSKAPDVLVSNPPYIKTGDLHGLSPEVQHEPVIALDGGDDGLDFYKIIATRFYNYLNPHSYVFLEVGYDIAHDVADVFRERKFTSEIITDMYGVERVCVAKKTIG